MSKNLTFKKELRHYNRGTETIVARLDSPVGEDGVAHRAIAEPNDETLWCDNNPRMIVKPESYYLVGPITDRLHEFEALGYEPEELEEIIRRYRMYRLAMNSQYGATGGFTYKLEKFHWIDEMHELPVEGPYHFFMNGIKDVAHMYPKMMIHSGPYPWGTKEMYDYIKADCEATEKMLNRLNLKIVNADTNPALPKIEDVRFNDPATIVFWADGTKTVVKAQPGETYDPEKGLAMAISKKALGNNHDYYIPFKKYLKKYYKNKRED